MKKNKFILFFIFTVILTIFFISKQEITYTIGNSSLDKIQLSTKEISILKALAHDDINTLLDGKKTVATLSDFNIDSRVNAKQLSLDYNANEVAADKKYKGKLLLINGTVLSIDKDLSGEAIIKLHGKSTFHDIWLEILNSEQEFAALLKNGNTVELVCYVRTYLLSNVIMQQCQNAYTYLFQHKIKSYSKFIRGHDRQNVNSVIAVSLAISVGQSMPDDSKCITNFQSDLCSKELKNIMANKDLVRDNTFKAIKNMESIGIVDSAILNK